MPLIECPRGKTGTSGNNWHHLWQQRRAIGNGCAFFNLYSRWGQNSISL